MAPHPRRTAIPIPESSGSAVGQGNFADGPIAAVGLKLQNKLRALRRLVRALLTLELAWWAAIGAACFLWISYGVDRLFEPPLVVRIVVILLLGGGIAAWLWCAWGMRAVRRLPEPQLALAFGRAYPQLADLLVTAAEAIASTHTVSCGNDARTDHDVEEAAPGQDGRADGRFRKLFLEAVVHEAERNIAHLQLRKVLRLRRVVLDGMLAIAALLTIVAFVAAAPQESSVWAKRWLRLEESPWPVRTGLVVKGFYRGEEIVLRGQPFELRVGVDLSMPLVPRVVKARLADEHGFVREVWLAREGGDGGTAHLFQPYLLRLPEVLGPLDLSLVAGDRWLRGLVIRPKEPASTKKVQARWEPPAYLALPPQEVPVGGTLHVPEGSRVRLLLEFTEPLVELSIEQNKQVTRFASPVWTHLRQIRQEGEALIGAIFDNRPLSDVNILQERLLEYLRSTAHGLIAPQADRHSPGQKSEASAERTLLSVDDPFVSAIEEAIASFDFLRPKVASLQAPAGPAPWQVVEEIRRWLGRWENVCLEWAEVHSFSFVEYDVGFVLQSTEVALYPTDCFGLTPPRPIIIRIEPTVDTAPRVSAELAGVGSAVTPQVRLRLKGEAVDDHGVDEVMAKFTFVDESGQDVSPSPVVTLIKPTGAFARVNFDSWVELADFSPRSGMRCQIRVQAVDRCNLRGAPQQGESGPWFLEIVAPDELRLLLEKREIQLRQQLDQVITELSDTAGELRRVVARAVVIQSQQTSNKSLDGASTVAGDNAPTASAAVEPARLLRRLSAQVEKSSQDVQTILDGVQLIREEIENNRLAAPGWIERLEERVIPPLTEAARKKFPLARDVLRTLESSLPPADFSPNESLKIPSDAEGKFFSGLQESARELEVIIQLLQTARAAMLELEDLRRVVELLREIIGEQSEVLEKTQEEHRRRLRQLIEPVPSERAGPP